MNQLVEAQITVASLGSQGKRWCRTLLSATTVLTVLSELHIVFGLVHVAIAGVEVKGVAGLPGQNQVHIPITRLNRNITGHSGELNIEVAIARREAAGPRECLEVCIPVTGCHR